MKQETTTIQTKGVSIDVKEKADQNAKAAGFSSIQDVLRIIIIDIANGELPLKIDWSYKRRKAIREALDDYERGDYIEYDSSKPLSEQIDGKSE